MNVAFNRVAVASKDDIERYKAALEGVQTRENRRYDRFDSGDIDRPTYYTQRLRLQEEQLQDTNLMQNAQTSISDARRETVQSIIELATNAESLSDHMSNEERIALLKHILSNQILDGVSMRYEIVKPLRILSEMK